MTVIKVAFAHACALLCVVVAFSAPAFADADLKKQVEQINSAYMESFNKQDAAGLVGLYATDPILIDQMGTSAINTKSFEGMFNAGFRQAEPTVEQVWPLGSDTALANGKYRFTGKTQTGAPIEIAGLWTAAYVREDGKWKVRMLTAFPKAK
jgi:ketosteroid isomerase-like protein